MHGHCHHKAVMKMHDEEEISRSMGLDYELLDSGCCGMAGSFGFESEHYDVSVKRSANWCCCRRCGRRRRRRS